MLKPVNVKGWPPSVNCVPEWPTNPAGRVVEVAVGAGVAVGSAVGVAVGLGVGEAVGFGVGVAVGFGVGVGVAAAVAVALGFAVGVAVGATALLTLNDVVSVVVALLVTISAVMLWAPAATTAVFHGLALPAESVPAKSSGAEPST
jgi:hypothetical protein